MKIILVLFLSLFDGYSMADESSIRNILDWDISQETYVKDDNGWLVEGIQTLPNQKLNQTVPNPGKHKKSIIKFKKTIKNNGNNPQQTLWLKNPIGYTKVYIDGELKKEHGRAFLDGTKGGRGDVLVQLPLEKSSIDLLVEVENSSYLPRGTGFYISPVLGSTESVYNYVTWTKLIDSALFGLLVISSLYHGLLYILRTKNIRAAIISVFSAATAIRVLTAGEGRVLLNTDIISPNWLYYLENFSGAVGVVGVIVISWYLLKPVKNRWFTIDKRWTYLGLFPAVCSVILCAIPIPEISDLGMNIFQFAIMLIIPTVFPWLFSAIVAGQKQALLIVLGFICIIAGALIDVTSFALDKGWYVSQPIGMSLFMVFQAAVLSIRFNRSFDELDDLNENLEQKVQEKIRDTRSTMDSIPQGIFRIVSRNDQFFIEDEYSSGMKKFVSEEIAESDPFEMIFSRWNLTSAELDGIRNALLGAYGEGLFQFDVNSHLLPIECRMGDLLLELDWRPVLGIDQNVNKVICVIKDVSKIRMLQEEALREAQGAVIIKEIARVRSYSKVDDFLNSGESYLLSSLNEISNLPFVYRNLHTVKGLAMTFGFKDMAKLTHDAESQVQTLVKEGKDDDGNLLTNAINLIIKEIHLYRENLNLIYGESKGMIAVQKSELSEVSSLIERGKNEDALKKLTFLYLPNFRRSLEAEISASQKLAERLGKEPPTFVFENDDHVISGNVVEIIRKSFIHLFRNSVDHGIETKKERVAAGKPESGTIQCKIEDRGTHFHVIYHDDGRGLNIPALENKFQQIHKTTPSTRIELVSCIFDSGFSTAKEITDISGRGVGMDAVKRFIESEGGTVEVAPLAENGENIPFELKISLPKEPVEERMTS